MDAKNTTNDEMNALTSAQKARVSLTMIVRNEERNLPHCLESVSGLFDEIIVVDTGSTDRTKEISSAFGACIVEFAWKDDFAAARNVSLANATGDYVFWLDADDVIDPPELTKLEALFARLRTDPKAAYVVRCASEPDKVNGGGLIVVDHVRLFPLLKDVRWKYRVHEQILPALLRAGIPVHWTDITVRHTGYADQAQKEQKRRRDCNILFKELAAHPHDPFVFFNLGMIVFERQQWQEALGYFSCSLSRLTRSEATESLRRKLFGMTAWTHQILGNLTDSLHICNEGIAIEPQDAELWFRKAVALRYLGKTNEAEACWQHILGLRRPNQFCSVDQGIYGHLTRRNLAIIAAERGDYSEATVHWRAVLNECPGDADAARQLMAI